MQKVITSDYISQLSQIVDEIDRQILSVPARAHLFIKNILTDLERDKEFFNNIFKFLEDAYIDEHGYNAGKAWSQFLAGWIKLKRGETDRALSIFIDVLSIFQSNDDLYGCARTLNAIGVCYMYQSNFTLAIEHFMRAIELSHEADFEEGVSASSINLGIVYYQLRNYEESKRYLQQSIEFEMISPVSKVIVQSYLASIMVEENNLQEASTIFIKCLDDCKTYNLPYTEIDIQNRFALLLEKRNQSNAESLLQASYAKAKSINNPRLIAECAILLAKQLFKKHQYDESLTFIEEMLHIAVSENISQLLADGKELKAKIYAELQEWQKAFTTLSESYEQEKKIYNEKLIGQSFAAHQNRIAYEKNQYKLEIKRLELISEAGTLIASAMDTKTIGSIIYNKLKNLMPINAFGIAIYNQKKNELHFDYYIENDTEGEPFTMHIDSKDSLAAYCIRNNKDILIRDVFKEYSNYVEKTQYVALDNNEPVHALMFCPILIGTSVKGVLTAQSRQIGVYKQDHLETLHALAAYAGVAIQNAKLFHDVQLLATTDPLTGIANRRKFMDDLFMEIERTARYGSNMSFIMFDIDLFKRINDTYGHLIGDLVLQKASELAKLNLRNTDFIGRYGGEEFTVLLPNTHLEGAKIVAERIRTSFEQAEIEPYPGKLVHFTASFGLAEFQDGDTMDSIIARSDHALYYAKETGRNKVAWER